uniref:Alba domain-containing protein n=1 Tax=Rhabditophanes sp. KR3021 TaxID=114890 RepID=A0AC35U2P7_9BILA
MGQEKATGGLKRKKVPVSGEDVNRLSQGLQSSAGIKTVVVKRSRADGESLTFGKRAKDTGPSKFEFMLFTLDKAMESDEDCQTIKVVEGTRERGPMAKFLPKVGSKISACHCS